MHARGTRYIDGVRAPPARGAAVEQTTAGTMVVIAEPAGAAIGELRRLSGFEVCPLVEVDDDHLCEIQRGRRPSYAFVPLLAERKLAADLDRVMTVEKPLVTTWERTPGWTTDAEARAFALVESWLKLAPESGRFTKIYGQVTTLEDLRAADYVDSDPLDLDHLSSRDDE